MLLCRLGKALCLERRRVANLFCCHTANRGWYVHPLYPVCSMIRDTMLKCSHDLVLLPVRSSAAAALFAEVATFVFCVSGQQVQCRTCQ